MVNNPLVNTNAVPAGLWRRLAAVVYDSIIVFALLMLATLIILPILGNTAKQPQHFIYAVYLLIVWFGFIAWFWFHGGQTLGMLAWKIELKTQNGKPLTLKQALIRFATAFPSFLCAGLGMLYLIFNREKYTLQDLCSKTQVYKK